MKVGGIIGTVFGILILCVILCIIIIIYKDKIEDKIEQKLANYKYKKYTDKKLLNEYMLVDEKKHDYYKPSFLDIHLDFEKNEFKSLSRAEKEIKLYRNSKNLSEYYKERTDELDNRRPSNYSQYYNNLGMNGRLNRVINKELSKTRRLMEAEEDKTKLRALENRRVTNVIRKMTNDPVISFSQNPTELNSVLSNIYKTNVK
jgi:hypothetical protein